MSKSSLSHSSKYTTPLISQDHPITPVSLQRTASTALYKEEHPKPITPVRISKLPSAFTPASTIGLDFVAVGVIIVQKKVISCSHYLAKHFLPEFKYQYELGSHVAFDKRRLELPDHFQDMNSHQRGHIRMWVFVVGTIVFETNSTDSTVFWYRASDVSMYFSSSPFLFNHDCILYLSMHD